MIRKLVRQMLTAQVFSALTVSLCLLIDNVMIGHFLGEKAIAAYGLANPVLLIIGAIGSLMMAGIQMTCSKSLGKGSQEETNAGYSTALAVSFGIALVFTALVLLFRSPIARALGAGESPELDQMTRDYMLGFVVGSPGSMGALILVPFMQMAGQTGLLITAVLSMTVVDIGLDLLNVLVFHGGMLGMGLASSISYYVALIIAAFYFLSRRCVFRFSWKQVSRAKLAELCRGGAPTVFGMASSVIIVFLLNQILLGVGGSDAVAAYAVISTIGNASNCITTGISGVSLTLSGIFYNEEDRGALRELIRLLARYSAALGLLVGVLLLIFAPALVSLFITGESQVRAMAVLGLRMFGAGLIPCCLNGALKNAYQATGRIGLTGVISVAEGVIFPVLAALVFSRFMGVTGVWFFFAAGETLTLIAIALYIRRVSGGAPWKNGAFLLLRQEFGVTAENLLEADIRSMDDVADVTRRAEDFCLRHGQSAKVSSHIALCVEEMAANVIQHGFEMDGKPHHLSVRILRKPGEWVLRFRDDCRSFDPVHYVPAGQEDALGIRLVLGLARDAQYTYTMNLNNLTLRLPAQQ